MELILRITERRQPSHLINNSVGVNPSVDGYLSTFPGVGGLRATKAGEVLEVEGGALWWQRPQRSPERKHNIKKDESQGCLSSSTGLPAVLRCASPVQQGSLLYWRLLWK